MEVSTAPFQCALSTRAGCECIVRVLQTLTELNPEATVTSIDGISAYDSISRKDWRESPVSAWCSLLSISSTPNLQCISGKMIAGGSTPFTRVREGSREIPSCHSSFPLANIQLWRQSSGSAQITL